MKLIVNTPWKLVSEIKAYFRRGDLIKRHHIQEEPLRAELFSSDQMDQHGKKLAQIHQISDKPIKGHLLSRLSDNEKELNSVRRLIVEAIKNNSVITPAGEWLIDNFYLIEEQIRTAKKHLPKEYDRALPQLKGSTGVTRVYDIALQIISHSDGQVDLEHLSTFVKSYQSISPLKIGELWAIPTMLRLALIENIRRIAAQIAADRINKNLADYWTKQLMDISEHDPKNLILVTGDMARSNPPMTSAFVSEMFRQLLGKGSALALSLTWIEQKLNEDGVTSNELINTEIQTQAANQLSISNSIGSLRLLNSIDWKSFVEEHSIIEQILRQDHNEIYSRMDFATRDRYRHAVEHLSKKSGIPENQIAKITIQLASQNIHSSQPNLQKSHVGYYLIGKGLSKTKKVANIHSSIVDSFWGILKKSRLLAYLGFTFLITIAISASFLLKAYHDTTNNQLLVLVSILAILASSQCAITIVNFFSTLLVKPHLLPSMDFSNKIPDDCSTLVVIPAMLANPKSIKELIKALEVRFLANRNQNLYFGLLTDFTDAPEQTLAEDQILLQLAQKRIEKLKKRYEQEQKRSIFFLFHRPRRWNASEKTWMGYERKRGKLCELNGLLRGGSKHCFSSIIGDISALKQVKYIITLDSDTQLPHGAAWKMIATMAHPLNHPIYSRKKKRITEGYGILQPRVTVTLPGSNSSFYSLIYGNEPGIDPYTRATSDVYQDLFGEGSFIGKGIYEIDTFEKTLKDQFPENRILSHDLLEGCYLRSGLLSNIELFEKYPMTYRSDMKRRTRWVRGDWQIFFWFLPYILDANGHLQKNHLSILSRWKIFDNIRRSLIPIALTSLIILGWTALHATLFWTVSISLVIVLPIFATLIWDAFNKPEDLFLSHHINIILRTGVHIIERTLFSLICIPYEAMSNLIAIVRTIWRMLVSHTHLLEWESSDNEKYSNKNNLFASYSLMWISPFLTFSILAYLITYSPAKLIIAGPILSLWALAPYITWFTNRSPTKPKALLNDKQTRFLFKVSRKTWGFFERFVGPEDNWLPPDNFQHHPTPVIAHHTSPTNIGLSLLANLTAHDFGYISTDQFLERTSNTINTLKRLERYRGHLYNWYHTQSLQPLPPKYISTVDSGNFAAHLLTLRQGIFELAHQAVANPKVFDGLADTLQVLKESMNQENNSTLLEFTTALKAEQKIKPHTLDTIYSGLIRLQTSYEAAIKTLHIKADSMAEWWKVILSQQIKQAIDDLQIISPWLSLPAASHKFLSIIQIDHHINLGHLFKKIEDIIPQLNAIEDKDHTAEENEWLQAFQTSLIQSHKCAKERLTSIETLSMECMNLADMEWEFLYNRSKHLLTIGYKVDDHICDPGYYDLLASEARLCTFVAIAQGKLPEESWFALGRLLTNIGGDPILLSWGGSMFEYLMPLLVMPTYENTLLDQTYKTAVKRQIEYGEQRNTPWGVSESGYNMVDASSNYQYQAFGVPGLGLKRSLEDDLVIAPYATALSLMIDPEASYQNLELLSESGFEGEYGFYEAIDYTASRLSRKQTRVIIQSFMAHHQGMSLLSLGYLLLGQLMQRRFEAEPQFQASLLLLQEHIPKTSAFFAHTTPIADFSHPTNETEVRTINTPDTLIPQIHLLSNGKYHAMLTNAGGGYSLWKNMAVTRWREDLTCDNWGTFCYVRDLDSGEYWSNTYQPTCKKGSNYEATFSQGRVDFHNSNHDIDTHTEIVISPEDDIEIRRIHLTNRSATRRTIDLTSYAEVVLAPPASDAMQPSFSNLFVQTEVIPLQHTIICSRRPRANDQETPWMLHSIITHGSIKTEISYETDRMEFIGHGNTVANPEAMNHEGPLSGKQGSVLDPIISIRCKFVLDPAESIIVDFITGAGDTREVCEKLIKKYQDKHHKNRVFELAWTHSQVILRQINATNADEQLFGRLASSIIFTNPALRTDPSTIIKNHKKQSDLWGYSVSGDLPIVLAQIADHNNISLIKQLIQAHTYWHLKGLVSDLIIWNEDNGGYRQDLHNRIQALIPNELLDRQGGIFVRSADQISDEDRILFQTVARVHISDANGTLADHVNRKAYAKSLIPYLSPLSCYVPEAINNTSQEETLSTNGLGYFSPDGSEYIITTNAKNRTPVPWANVIANPNFGTIITESGHSYTWTENAHEMRLTPWNNDLVSDSTGEVFYLRDEEVGDFWSVTPLPRGGESPYTTKHGFGYSIFEHNESGIYSTMTTFVDLEQPVKFTILKIHNRTGKARRLSATGYIEWVLGDLKPKTAMHIITEIDPNTGAFFAKNPYNTEFGNRVAFFDTDEVVKTSTGDRTEFIGRNGSLQNPDAMYRLKLSGKVGVPLDPCAAMQVYFELADGEERELVFRLGTGKDMSHAYDVIYQSRGLNMANEALEKVKNYWNHTTHALQIETPDSSINMLANGWLTYQTLSSRLWGRSGYYQSGGAFGFRDQLQDVISLLHTEPALARKQILLSAAHQFQQGDVQHWWHPPIGRGVRTRISDDFLWLPFTTYQYIMHTGDIQILDESACFLEGRLLNPKEESYYELPAQSKESATLYDHCVKAIEHGLNFGEHGLPLIGTGDWNDGMDRVGHHGKGESVWLGFFLYDILIKFIQIANMHNDPAFAVRCKKYASKLSASLEEHGWDGKWYRRAYFDDGTPLGSSSGTECQIDSISQSWSVLSGAGKPEHSLLAMKSAENRLVKKDAGIIQLLDPPFDKADIDPGYIKGYVPGVRENGGQYTHAAIWMIMAFAKLGDSRRTWELLQMINPLNHGKTKEDIAIYKVEPYVMAADVYALPPHTGRGGWTWYTGSASWMYQLIIESFLGLRREADKLRFDPCIPAEWKSFKVHYRYYNTMYHITVQQKKGTGETTLSMDGHAQKKDVIPLTNDEIEHHIQVTLFRKQAKS